MKFLLFPIILMFIFVACKNDISTPSSAPELEEILPSKELSIQDKVAIAYGIDNWPKVSQVEFSLVM